MEEIYTEYKRRCANSLEASSVARGCGLRRHSSDFMKTKLWICFVCFVQALSQPHDLVSSVDESDVFVVEIGPNRVWKLSSKPQTGSFILKLYFCNSTLVHKGAILIACVSAIKVTSKGFHLNFCTLEVMDM